MTVSPAMRRYAAEIYRLQEDNEQVPLSLLSSEVDTSAQAISTMVKRLSKSGYLIHEPYRGVRLTESGETIAMPSLRRHRLTEVFLVKIMKYDWASAHTLSDTFERGVNEELEDRMDELAGYPTRCPHGEPIPSKDGVMPVVKDEPLSDVPSGSDCVVSRVRTHDIDKLHQANNRECRFGYNFRFHFQLLLSLYDQAHEEIVFLLNLGQTGIHGCWPDVLWQE